MDRVNLTYINRECVFTLSIYFYVNSSIGNDYQPTENTFEIS